MSSVGSETDIFAAVQVIFTAAALNGKLKGPFYDEAPDPKNAQFPYLNCEPVSSVRTHTSSDTEYWLHVFRLTAFDKTLACVQNLRDTLIAGAFDSPNVNTVSAVLPVGQIIRWRRIGEGSRQLLRNFNKAWVTYEVERSKPRSSPPPAA